MSDAISKELREAFHQAIGAYELWERGWGADNPQIQIGDNAFSMSGVCELVGHFAGPVPHAWYEALLGLARRKSNGRFVPENRTYQSAAKSLQGLIAYALEQRRRIAEDVKRQK